MRSIALLPALAPAFVVVASVVSFGCSSTSTGTGPGGGGAGGNRAALDAATLCDKIINECKQDLAPATCDVAFSTMRVSQECAAKINGADCTSLGTIFSGNDDTCFPACDNPGGQTCNGDGTMSTCSDSSRTLVLDCGAVCQKASSPPKEFSGTCGTSFNGQQSEDGEDKCWCK